MPKQLGWTYKIMQVISSERNPAIQSCLKILRGKMPPGEKKLVLEGTHLIDECVRAGIFIETFFFAPEVLPSRVQQRMLLTLPRQTRKVPITPSLLRRITLTETPQGAVAVAVYPAPDPKRILNRKDLFLLIADRVQDPGNLGTIIRTSAAAGMHAIFCTPGTVDYLNPKVVRSTAGAIFHTEVISIRDPQQLLGELKKRRVKMIAADPGARLSYDRARYPKAMALVIGNESSGISPELLQETDLQVRIPLKRGIDSLNASVAAAIIIYEALRQRTVQETNAGG